VYRGGTWQAAGDPMDAAISTLAQRLGSRNGAPGHDAISPVARIPFTAARMISSAVGEHRVSTIGAPERVFERCAPVPEEAHRALERMTSQGRRVLAVASRAVGEQADSGQADDPEQGLDLLGLLGLEDPPRPDVHEALQACRDADIRVIMVTGDHPGTAEAIAREVGLLRPGGVVLPLDLPADDDELGKLLDHPEGAVVARVTPADKLRIGCSGRADTSSQ